MRWLLDHQDVSVRLTDERLAHILEHPEMADMDTLIEETLRDPQILIRSRTDSACLLAYRFQRGTRVGDKWLCVVIKYAVGDAFVLTAYLTDRIKTGEQLWPRT